MFSRQLSRTFATSAKSVVPVPLALHGIDGRYATALYTAAVKSNQMDVVESELKKIQGVVEKDESIRLFLENPVLSSTAKKQGVEHLMAKYSELTRNFFVLLAENRRLNETVKIADAYSELMSAHRGEISVVVTTAKDFDSKLQNQLKQVLAKSSLVKKGAQLKIIKKVNPSLMGGLIVEIGDKSIDLSISSRLSKLNKLISDTI